MKSDLTKSYYKIREVEEYLDLPAATLRYWEKEFPELKPRRSVSNRRTYTPSDIELLEIIRYLLHVKGLKINAAKEYLRHNRQNITKRLEIVNKLQNVREELEQLLKALNLRVQKS